MRLPLRLLPCAGLAALLTCALPASQALAQGRHAVAHTGQVAEFRGEDPMATIYIVTSDKDYEGGIKTLARKIGSYRDSMGTPLVLAELKAHELEDLTRHVHEKEQHCGGYFAFATRAEAERFVRSERAAQAIAKSFAASYTIDNQEAVAGWLPQVGEPGIRGTIAHLSTAWPNRYYASSHGRNAALWIRDTWLAMAHGRSDVSAELFTACTNCSTQPSVILTIRGNELPNEIVVLGGHLDSIRQGAPASTAETMIAPGADDDASGIATLTEVLRIAMANGYRPKRTVMFMAYAAEEVGLRGSNAIAQSFRAQGRNVVGVLQLDMTNWKSPSAATDIGLITDFSNASLLQFVQDLFATYLAPSGYTLGLDACGYACSDHASWTAAGYPSAMPDEGPVFPYLHTPNDTLQQMGDTAAHSTILAKLALAFLGELGKSADASTTLPGWVRVHTSARDVPITDNATAESGIFVARRNGKAPAITPVAVRILHAARGELKVDLVAPSGTVYNLANRTGGTTDNIVETYAVDLSAESMNGSWTLRVNDNVADNVGGFIDSWSISL